MEPVKKRRHTTIQDIEAAVQSGGDPYKVATLRDISERSVRRYIARLENSNGMDLSEVADQRGGAYNVKFDEEMLEAITGLIEEFPDLTLEQINLRLQTQLPGKPPIDISTIWKHLEGSLITLKKLHVVPEQRNSLRTKELRHFYAQTFMETRDADFQFVYLDETGWSLLCRRGFGRSRMGKRANLKAPSMCCKHVNMVAAISPNVGWILHRTYNGSFTKELFTQFVRSVLENLNARFPGTCFCLVADNASIHGRELLDVVIAEPAFQRHKFLFLPPYSPVLNPIENAFSCVKASLKRMLAERTPLLRDIEHLPYGQKSAARMELLQQLIAPCMAEVTQFKAMRWYEHCCSYLPACISDD